FNALLGALVGQRPADLLSGYRVLSRRVVKSFPAGSHGFDIATEMTAHAAAQRLPIDEVATPYFEREPNSQSKLSTFRDGLRILRTTLVLFGDERPLVFFGFMAILAATASVVLGIDIVVEFMRTHLVPRL